MNVALLRRWWPLAAVAGLLALASLAAAHSSFEYDRRQPPAQVGPTLEPRQPSAPDDTAPREVTGAEMPQWVPLAASVLCGIAVLVVIVLALWILLRDVLRRRLRLGRNRGEKPATSAAQTAQEVVAALDAGLVGLSDTDADPRRAVIACWVRLEQAAAAAGMAREPGDTPTDLVTRLLAGGPGVSADVLAAFAQVYREARYATHTVDGRMRDQAQSALRRLRAELTAAVGR